jgi:hypothetical protein
LNTDKTLPRWKKSKLRRRSENNHMIDCGENYGPLDMTSNEQRKRRGEEQIPSIGSEHEGPTTIGSEGKLHELQPLCEQED